MTSGDTPRNESAARTPRESPRVLLCAAEFPPLGGGGVIRMAKLAKYLPQLGWQVTVACSDEPLGDAVDRSLLDEIPGTVRIARLRPPLGKGIAVATAGAKSRLDRGSRAFRLLYRLRSGIRGVVAIPDRWIGWALTVARQSPEALGHPEVVVTSGPPHSVHVAGALLARRLRVPLVADLRDEWSLRPLMRSRLPWRRAADRWVERWCLRRAAHVVVVSDVSAGRYRERYPWLAGRVSVIPNGFDPDDLPAAAGVPPEAARDVLTIGYAGTFQVGLDVRPLFEALGRVLAVENRGGPRVRFTLLGAFRPEDASLAARFISPDALSIQPFLPHREALARVAGWNVLLVVANDGQASLAGKTYELLALRKPVLVVAPEGPATRLVARSGAGESAPPDDADAIAEAVRRVLASATNPSFTGAPLEFLEPFDRRRQAQTWSALLGRLVGAERSGATASPEV